MNTTQHTAFRQVAKRLMAMSNSEFLCRLNKASSGEFSQALLETTAFLNQQHPIVTPPEQIRGGTLTLCRTSSLHAEALLAHWGSDENTFTHLSSRPVNTPELINTVIEKSVDAWVSGRFFRYTLLAQHDTPAGMLTLTPHAHMPGYLEIGLSLGSAFWRQSYGRQAISLVQSVIHAQQPQLRLFATCLDGSAGHSLLSRCGFTCQGVLPRGQIYTNAASPNVLCTLYTLE